MMSVGSVAMAELQQLVEANPSIDWRAIALDDRGALDALDWRELEPAAMVPLLKAYQRVVRILPATAQHRALALLGSGLHSAIQVADIPQDEFACQWAALFPGEDALGFAVHRAARSRRGELLLHHINNIQSNEPHYRAARFK